MANIPTIPIPGAETSALPTPYDQRQRSPAEFGASIGGAMEQAGAVLERHAAEADALAAQEAETSYAQTVLKKIHGSVDPNTGEFQDGFRQLRGHAAIDASNQTTQDLASVREQIATGLQNERQRRLFLSRTQNDLIAAQRSIEGHVEGEVEYLKKATFDTRIATAAQAAASAYNDPQEREYQLQAMWPWLDLAAEQNGLKGDEADRFIKAQQGKVVTAVAERMLEDTGRGRVGMAKDTREYLDAHRDMLDEKDVYRFRAQLAAGDLRERSLVESDRIWAETDGDPLKAALAVRGIKDTDLRDATDQRVKQRIAEDHAVRVAADSPREARLESIIYQRGGLDRNAADYQALSDEGRARVDAKFFAYQRSLRAEGTNERRAQNDADRDAKAWFNALPLKGETGRDRVSLDIDHAEALANASPRARDEIRRLQQDANGLVERGLAPKFSEFETLVASQAGTVLKSKANRDAFKGYMTDWWTAEVKAKGGALPDRATIQAKIADALLYGDAAGGFVWATDRYKFQAEQKGEGFVPFRPGEQKYAPARGAPAAPAAPAPAPGPMPRSGPTPAQRVGWRRTVNGETRVWNGSAWVKE